MPATTAAAPAQAPEPLEAVPAKPTHKIRQLTTGELARERSRLEAALRRPYSEDVRALLRGRLDAVLAEQDERNRTRQADTTAAKAALAAGSAEQAARAAYGPGAVTGMTSARAPCRLPAETEREERDGSPV